jgi:hypothetical protein
MARTPKTPDTEKTSATSDVPKGRLRQVWMVYKVTRQIDKKLDWWMLLGFLGTVAISALIGVILHAWIYLSILGISLGLFVVLAILARRAESAMYTQAEGLPGGSVRALQNLRRGWSYDEQPVQFDPRTQDAVFRAIGRPGVILLAEGPTRRVFSLVAQERKRLRVLGSSVPITVINVGVDEGQVPLRKVSGQLIRMRPVISKTDVSKVYAILRPLGGIRPPIPKGVDPTRMRPDRRTR